MRRSAGSTPPCTTTISKTGRGLSRARWISGRRQRFRRARGNGRRPNGRPPRFICSVLLDDPGSSRSPDPHLRAQGPDAFSGAALLRRLHSDGRYPASPRSSPSAGPGAAGEKAAAHARSQDRHETPRHDMIRLRRLKTVSVSNRASAFRCLSNRQLLPCRHTLPRALPTPGASPQSAMPVCSGRLQWRLSADANLRQKGVGSPTQCRLRATTNYRHCSAAERANHAVGPNILLASAQGNPASPLALRASTAPRHYRIATTPPRPRRPSGR